MPDWKEYTWMFQQHIQKGPLTHWKFHNSCQLAIDTVVEWGCGEPGGGYCRTVSSDLHLLQRSSFRHQGIRTTGLPWPATCLITRVTYMEMNNVNNNMNGPTTYSTASTILGGFRIHERTWSTRDNLERHSEQDLQRLGLTWKEAEAVDLKVDRTVAWECGPTCPHGRW